MKPNLELYRRKIAEWALSERLRASVTISEAANSLQVEEATLLAIENGESSPPLKTLAALASLYSADPQGLVDIMLWVSRRPSPESAD